MWDGYEIMRGNIRLNSVTTDKDDITYNITFYNQVGDLAANIGDKFLRDLDLTDLSHPYTAEVIPYSQVDWNLFPLTGATNYSYQDGRTMFGLYNIGYNYISGNSVDFQSTPLVQFSPFTGATYAPIKGFFDYSGTPVWDYYFKPSLQIKTLYQHIINQAGYEISSNFFNTNYFERFYLPLKFLDETVYDRSAKQPCYAYGPQSYKLDCDYFYYTTNPLSAVTCNNGFFSANTTQLDLPAEYFGQYTFKISYNLSGEGVTRTTLVNTNCAGSCDYTYTNCSGVTTTGSIPAIDCNLPYYFLDGTVTGGCVASVDTVPGFCALVLTTPTGGYYPLRYDDVTGSTIGISFETTFTFTGATTFSLVFNGIGANVSDFRFEVTKAPRFLQSGDTIDYALEFPPNDYKQIDFITSINRYFNLIVVPNPDKPDQLIVEPIIDYIGKGNVLDWTTKIDHLQPITVQPTTSIINGTLIYEFLLDQDYANQNYKMASNRIFGTEKKNLGLDYKNASTNFGFIFGSPLDITIYSAYQSMLTLPSFSKINQKDEGGKAIQQFVPFKILPRLLFRGPVLPQDNYGYVGTSGSSPYQSWYLRDIGVTSSQDRFQEINRFTTYPFNYNGFSHYTNWRGEDTTTIQPPEFQFVAEDLYDIYYKDYIDDLISDENKIYQAKIYLYPEEIKALRFDEKIIVDNAYFRINKISKYNLLEPSLCDIELIKLTKTYQGHRVLYYDLYPCASGGTVYHSNSDLNYNLYAYANNYVKLYDDDLNYLGCYEIQVGDYDETYTYQHFYISSGYTPNLVAVYPNCGCTGRTPFDIVQETPEPSPTPSNTPNLSPTPTPSITPTISLTPSNTPTYTPTPSATPPESLCRDYQITSGEPQTISWTTCGGVPQTQFIEVGDYFISCAIIGSVSATGLIIPGPYC